jgi:glycosyltransferase involved in cell wall biosynthesis
MVDRQSAPSDTLGANPLVSVVTPFFNRRDYLARAVDSVIAQTYENWELVLVDDGSTDGSEVIAQRYVAQYPGRILLIQQANAGETAARNRAIEAATGELIGILDSDDEWNVDFLARGVAAFAACPQLDWLYVNAQRKANGGQIIVASVFDDDRSGPFRQLATEQYGDVRVITDPRLLETAIRYSVKAGANSLVGTRVFARVQYPRGIKVGGDRALVIAAIAADFTFGYLDQVLLTVYHHESNASLAAGAEPERELAAQAEMIRAYEYVERNVPLNRSGRAALKSALAELHYNRAVSLLDRRAPLLQVAGELSKSLRLKPTGSPIYTTLRKRVKQYLHV